MEPETRKADIERLRSEIELTIGRKMHTPRDFEYLRQCIYARQRTLISSSTLKRVWEYMPQGKLRFYTLSSLAGFLGYQSWDHFIANERTEGASDYVLSRHLWVDRELKQGDIVRLTWEPGRCCLIRYLGKNNFVVTQSANTRLKAGDTFSCGMIVENEPLFLDKLSQNGSAPTGYVCGKISGIKLDILPAESFT